MDLCGPVRKCGSLWTCGRVDCGQNIYMMYVTESVDLRGPVGSVQIMHGVSLII